MANAAGWMNAEECARRVNRAMATLPARITLEARADPADPAGITVILTTHDAAGKPEDIKEQTLAEASLFTPASHTSPERLEAFLFATARWLGAQAALPSFELFPHDIFVGSLLRDPRLVTFTDFAAVLEDPVRREVYVARAELETFFGRHRLGPTDDGSVLALYALTPEGRASSKGVDESVRAIAHLASFSAGQVMLVAMMHEWANEEYDPFDVAWPNGPRVPHLLLTAAWRRLDPLLLDASLRRHALDAFDRMHQPAGARES